MQSRRSQETVDQSDRTAGRDRAFQGKDRLDPRKFLCGGEGAGCFRADRQGRRDIHIDGEVRKPERRCAGRTRSYLEFPNRTRSQVRVQRVSRRARRGRVLGLQPFQPRTGGGRHARTSGSPSRRSGISLDVGPQPVPRVVRRIGPASRTRSSGTIGRNPTAPNR